jgi:hypothetical protein
MMPWTSELAVVLPAAAPARLIDWAACASAAATLTLAYWSAFWMIASIQFVVAVEGAGAPVPGVDVGVVDVAGGAAGVVDVVGAGVVTEVVGACLFGPEGPVELTLGGETTACACGVLGAGVTRLAW